MFNRFVVGWKSFEPGIGVDPVGRRYTSPLVGDLSPSVPNERVPYSVYLTCPVLRGSKTEI